jgi:hypothetical protein
VFYDDNRTIREKLDLYRGRGIAAVAFWRIGQGPPELWNSIDHGDLAAPGDVSPSVAQSGPAPGPVSDQ